MVQSRAGRGMDIRKGSVSAKACRSASKVAEMRFFLHGPGVLLSGRQAGSVAGGRQSSVKAGKSAGNERAGEEGPRGKGREKWVAGSKNRPPRTGAEENQWRAGSRSNQKVLPQPSSPKHVCSR